MRDFKTNDSKGKSIMANKQIFEAPVVEVIELNDEVITTSLLGCGTGNKLLELPG